jgi:cell wall-associated NlpC family hydrolase
MPLVATPRNLARLADQMLGQPYGWGGYLQNRDCSALMLDLLSPFGMFLPRNSSQQAKSGEYVSFEGLSAPQKETLVLSRGVPLLTLLYKRGHIMLYLGRMQGRALMLHDIWGLKTLDERGAEGRKVIGRVAITTLEPGGDLPEVARAGTLLEHMAGMTLLAPGGNPPPTPDRTR